MLAIIDYKAGNQTSVRRALDYLGIPCAITSDTQVIEAAQGIIFPGVGAAGQAMNELARRGMDKALREQIAAGKPMLGICIGCQVLLDYSPENDTTCLGIVPGRCEVFEPTWTEEDGRPVKVPHMGWNSVRLLRECELFAGIDPGSEFYFVHSYYPAPEPEHVIGVTEYGREFCSIYGRRGLWATQFHPEKSGRPGLRLLTNFHAYCLEVANAQ